MRKKSSEWFGGKFTRIFHGSSQEQSDPLELKNDTNKAYRCQFCHQSGKDRFKSGPCRVCSGLGTVKRQYQKTIECGHCQGKGVEPYHAHQCKVCGGIGVIEKIEESLQKAPIPITYSRSESSGKSLDIDLSNELLKATKKEQ